jgi:hypothetical protein
LPHDSRYWELTGHPPCLSFRAAAARTLETEAPQPGVRGWVARQEERLVHRVRRT